MLACLWSLLFPRHCIHCGEALGLDGPTVRQWHYLCEPCAGELRGIDREHTCHTCGVPLYGITSGPLICGTCRDTPPLWTQSYAFVRYLGPARRWVRDYKYKNAQYLEREWGKLFGVQGAQLRQWLAGATLVPVPLHPLKQLFRGFNQAERLCHALERWANLGPQLQTVPLIKRTRWTSPQARLKRKERAQNVKNAFDKARQASDKGDCPKRVILVDDLLTTGFTLSACAAVLKKSGVERVDILTFARG